MLLPAQLGALLGLVALISVGFWFKVAISARSGDEIALRRNLTWAATGLALFLAIVAFGFLSYVLADLIW